MGINMTALATPADMTKRFDQNTLKDLCSDSGTPVADLSTDANLLALLDDATGAVKSALLNGGLYTADDLDDIADESESFLKRIVCDLALAYLIQRRPEKYGKNTWEAIDRCNAALDQFRAGARVFELDGQIAAGLPTIDGPRQSTYRRLNMLPDRTRNYYPHRQQRLPLGR